MDRYDPDAPEGSKPRGGGGYVTKKDFRLVILIFPIVLIALYPVYLNLKRDSDKKICGVNIQAIGKAIQSYTFDNDDRFPPVYAESPEGGPLMQAGAAVNWLTLIEPGMTARAKTFCPSAAREENSLFYSSIAGGPREASYGLFFPTEGMATYQLRDPKSLILVTETANNGAQDTYNPRPILDGEDRPVGQDGFMIGFDNPDGNFEADDTTQFVTRLAFRNSAGGYVRRGIEGRHSVGNHVVYADGSGGAMTSAEARATSAGSLLPRWRVR